MIGVLEKEVMVRNAGQPSSFLMPRSGEVDIPAVCWLLVLMWWHRIRTPMRFPKY
jgi:hypothetical protein